MRRLRSLSLGLIPPLVFGFALLLLPASDTAAQDGNGPNPTTSNCSPFLDRYAEPTSLELGETAKIVLNVEPNCPDYRLPIDLVFLVDVSNSMTRGTPGGNNDAGEDPPPGNVDPPGGGDPPKVPPPGSPPPDPPPPVKPLAFRLNPGLASIVPFQDPPPEKPDPPPNVPGDPGARPNPNAEPPGCEQSNDAIGPGGNDAGPPGNTDPSDPKVPPTPKVTQSAPDPGQPAPTKTPAGGNVPGPGQNDGPAEDPEPAGSEDLIRDAQRFIRDFFDEPQIQEDLAGGALRVGMVSFNNRGRRLVSLTEQGKRAATRVSLLRGGGLTRIDIGLRTAERVLQDRNRRYGILHDDDRTKVIVVISDGGFCDRDLRARVQKEIEIVGLFAGRGPYKRRMRDIVTENEYLLDLNARALKELMFIYGKDFLRVDPVNMETLTLKEQLADTMELVPGSVSNGGVVNGSTIEWAFAPPDASVTVTYEVKPLQEGYLDVTDESDALWTDNKARDGSQPFPDVRLSVNYDPPTPTSPPPPTPTDVPPDPPTATPEVIVLKPAYLPVAFREEEKPDICEPSRQRVDLAVVIDTSISMSDATSPGGPPKIDAAIAAAKGLVGQLKFASGNQDQATVIGFNSRAALATRLTFDRVAIDTALDVLKATQAPGTRIDLGLDEARAELNSARIRQTATQTIVLVTDALQNDLDAGGRQQVTAAANLVRSDGISLFTVGIGAGADIDEALLQSIATRPEFYIHAPDASTLETIYRERIAPLIPCP